MQMEEVRPVLHVIFRHLLKRLDDQELREQRGSRQGKTCPFIHIWDFPDSDKAVLWRMWMMATNGSLIHCLSTNRGLGENIKAIGFISRFCLVHRL